MIRRTFKYDQAIAIAPDYPHATQEALYEHLQDRDLFWNSKTGYWESIKPEDSDPPSDAIRVRVMTGRDRVSDIADRISELLEAEGFILSETSRVYPCRPPKANDGCVYLTFTRRRGNS